MNKNDRFQASVQEERNRIAEKELAVEQQSAMKGDIARKIGSITSDFREAESCQFLNVSVTRENNGVFGLSFTPSIYAFQVHRTLQGKFSHSERYVSMPQGVTLSVGRFNTPTEVVEKDVLEQLAKSFVHYEEGINKMRLVFSNYREEIKVLEKIDRRKGWGVTKFRFWMITGLVIAVYAIFY